MFSENDTSDAASKCSGYLESMVQFKTFFFLSLYNLIISLIEKVNVQIQFSPIGASEVETNIKFFTEVLGKKCGDYGSGTSVWTKN